VLGDPGRQPNLLSGRTILCIAILCHHRARRVTFE